MAVCSSLLLPFCKHTHTEALPRPLANPVPVMCADGLHVIPQDGASCFDNSCEVQCLLQQNTDWPISSKMSALCSLLHHPKEDRVAFPLCDPVTQNRNILSTGIMIPFVC